MFYVKPWISEYGNESCQFLRVSPDLTPAYKINAGGSLT